MQMFRCIYCRSTSDRPFPAEHVVPRAFGMFSNNLTVRCVCGDCNNYFSRDLELHFARNSGEGVVRYRHGMRESHAPSFGSDRFITTISTPGKLFGAQVRLTPNITCDGIGFDWIPQVGFEEKESGKWRWFTEDQLEEEFLKGVQFGSKVCYITTNAEIRERLRAKLLKLGFKFGPKQYFEEVQPQTQLSTRVKWQFDRRLRRCIAKIAFNHLAYVCDQDAGFLDRADFDAVCNYVRYGIATHQRESNIVLMMGEPQLGYSSPAPFGGGHLIVTSWDALNRSIISQVSIFGVLMYQVLLSGNYSGAWFEIRGGHYFDVIGKEARAAQISRYIS